MKMRKCKSCETYTLKEKCPKCGNTTVSPNPPKFSPEDKYGKWRRLGKIEHEKHEYREG
jgi:H/ACA ribonucleoprotein complex subunit 3